jgi:hypothetical protein
MNDGQGITVGTQGVPFAVEAVNAPAGTDAAAILAFTDPTEAVASTTPIDLEYQLPPSIRQTQQPGVGGHVSWALGIAVLALLLALRK